ncbi:hypothetical protein AMATHDRAFT_86013 [Amanita thiersii Skay4041]|uniref:NADP-dependent oxidoreductase domain-containing protein n=1 Tax=Amanita thiersii Skay4041 TaxID=703135 RepID=A0A2A9NHN5_9AGAR|nr:hypothetical protein AMATHDRAFT_86013 [Amanita thiersii Skay4041]
MAETLPKKKVPYVRLGDSGLKISRLVLGTMQYGSPDWQPWMLSEDDAVNHIKQAYEAGIQTFDTANVYSNGMSEVILGKAIKKLGLPREEIVVMTKLRNVVPKDPGTWFVEAGKNPDDYGYVNQGGLSRKHIFAAVKASLERLQLDYVDVLQCHRADPDTPIEETMKALHDVVQAGYARYIGMGSCWAWQFHTMQNYAINNNLTPFISMQHQYSLLYREDELEMLPTMKLFNVGGLAWSPLARGLLSKLPSATSKRSTTDRFLPFYKKGPLEDQVIIERVAELSQQKGVSMAQIGIAWMLHKPGIAAPIIGPTSPEQLHDSIGALEVSLTERDLAYLEEPYRRRPVMGFK